MMTATYVLLALLVGAALWAVLTPTLLRGAIALALTSALLTLVMFQMEAPLAGVFELSVCAGLITVVFVSAISLTSPTDKQQDEEQARAHAKSFLPLLAIAAWVGALLWAAGYAIDTQLPRLAADPGVRAALWSVRRVDLVGQIIIIFVGVFGVVILFKEQKEAGK